MLITVADLQVDPVEFDLAQYAKDHPNSLNKEGLTAYEEFIEASKTNHHSIMRTPITRQNKDAHYEKLRKRKVSSYTDLRLPEQNI